MDVSGKTVLVTGGGSGIGEGLVEAFVEKGARVAVADIALDRAREVAARLGKAAMGIEIDVASPHSWTLVHEQVRAHFGEVDVLCNNAGISLPFKPMEEVSLEQFDRVMAINVRGVFLGCKTFIPAMKARRSGHIVNTSSVNGQLPHGTFATYCASKFAVAGMSEALQQELAPHGVGVSILYPGLTRSRMSESQMPDLPEDARKALSEKMMEPIWLGRAVVRAVETNQLHINSHVDHKPAVQARLDALMASFGEPAQPGYGGFISAVADLAAKHPGN